MIKITSCIQRLRFIPAEFASKNFFARMLRTSVFVAGLCSALSALAIGASNISVSDNTITVTGSGSSTLNFAVSRTGDTSEAAYLSYQTADGTALAGTDYTAASGTLLIPAGSGSETIPVTIAGSSSNPPDKTFLLNLLGATGPTPSFPASPDNFAADTFPRSVAVADFNTDGTPDLVVANQGVNHDVSVLLNTTTTGATTSTFSTTQITLPVGTIPYSVAVGDFNADGKPDLAVTDYNGGLVWVLLNTTASGAATPSYAAAVSFTVGTHPESVAVGDFNADGKPDLVVANFGGGVGAIMGVSVLLNTTAASAVTPTFATAANFAAGSGPISVAVGDFNGDSNPDLAVADNGGGVSVLLNTTAASAATPSYAAAVNFAAGAAPFAVAVGDFNGDGKLDLAVASYSGELSVLLNTAAASAITPSYAAAVNFTAGTNPQSVAVGDFNGDGKPDLAVANNGSSNVSVLLNTTTVGAATPSYATAVNFAAGSGPFSVAVGDFNSDSKSDLAVANQTSNNVSVLLNSQYAVTVGSAATGTIHYNVPLAIVVIAGGALGVWSLLSMFVLAMLRHRGRLTQWSRNP